MAGMVEHKADGHTLAIYWSTASGITECQICSPNLFSKEQFADKLQGNNPDTMSLTALSKHLTGKKYAIAGPKFFKYKGEWLNSIRERMGV